MNSSHETHDVNASNALAHHSVLCQQAHYQMEAMLSAMLKAAQAQNVEALPYLVQAIAIRIDALNSAMMCAVDGDPDAVESLRNEVFGSPEHASSGVLQ